MKKLIDWTDSATLRLLEAEAEQERQRLAGWVAIPEFKKNDKIKEKLLFKARRCAEIREAAKLLAEIYEQND